MKAFQLLHSTVLHSDMRGFHDPMTIQELVTVVGFLALVGGGVFLMLRLRGSDKPPASLNSRHFDEGKSS